MHTKAPTPIRSHVRSRGLAVVAACAAALMLVTENGAALAQKSKPRPSGQAAKSATNVSYYHTPHTPKVGSTERKAILDVLRADVQDEYKMPVKFVIHTPEKYYFRVAGAAKDWAFVSARYVQPDGSPMDKKYWAMVGDMSDDVQALLHQVNGKWKVVVAITAVTDVEWEDWHKKYHAPAAVIPPMNP